MAGAGSRITAKGRLWILDSRAPSAHQKFSLYGGIKAVHLSRSSTTQSGTRGAVHGIRTLTVFFLPGCTLIRTAGRCCTKRTGSKSEVSTQRNIFARQQIFEKTGWYKEEIGNAFYCGWRRRRPFITGANLLTVDWVNFHYLGWQIWLLQESDEDVYMDSARKRTLVTKRWYLGTVKQMKKEKRNEEIFTVVHCWRGFLAMGLAGCSFRNERPYKETDVLCLLQEKVQGYGVQTELRTQAEYTGRKVGICTRWGQRDLMYSFPGRGIEKIVQRLWMYR